ncbi:MAG: hydroxylamine reductase [Oligoflexia bacterium]|nr:hydroxylamine reductase [Oligoflexia bacterium]
MSMFCFQCQEAMKGQGCNARKGMCGKEENTAVLQDLLIHVLKGISLCIENVSADEVEKHVYDFLTDSLFATITNANFDESRFVKLIKEGLTLRNDLKEKYSSKISNEMKTHDSLNWYSTDEKTYNTKAQSVGVLSTTNNEDQRSLRELLIYGTKGVAAYAHHALVLGYRDNNIYHFYARSLASTTKNLTQDQMVALVLEAGKIAVDTMALLDKANTETYGNPEITKVNIGVRNNPAILISGHDLKDMEELLKQTEGTGVDVYTHSEMLAANYYPAFKKYKHFVGNYGNAWWKQEEEFEKFNGPILMTTNCITPVQDSYRNRIFTTGVVGYTGIKHISSNNSGKKDFSEIIALAKKCQSPIEIEKGEIVGGFAHNQVMAVADKVVEAVKSGAIKKFIVMAGCDGRHKSRDYFSEVAKALPKDIIILTAGCAKYRYNKLNLGDIGGIPRVLDAGQCNDSYSLAVIALKLKEVFALKDVNELPLDFDIAWYEQKAVAVLLALLHLGFKNIRLGPTLPAFLSTNVVSVLVKNFNIKPIKSVEEDISAIVAR